MDELPTCVMEDGDVPAVTELELSTGYDNVSLGLAPNNIGGVEPAAAEF